MLCNPLQKWLGLKNLSKSSKNFTKKLLVQEIFYTNVIVILLMYDAHRAQNSTSMILRVYSFTILRWAKTVMSG